MSDNRLNILLIEDLPEYVFLIKRILEKNSIEVKAVSSLLEGMKLLENQCFDAVLLDLGLPDSNGLRTFTKFQSYQPYIPVIILSGLDDETVAANAVQLGAQDYLTKGNYLIQGDAGSKLLVRSLQYAIERNRIQNSLLQERRLLEARVHERTSEIRKANQQLRILASRLVSAQEDERRRISIELHDEAGQALTALQLNLSVMRNEVLADQSRLDEQLQEAIVLTASTLELLRALAHDLHPPSLDNVGLNFCLKDYCEKTAARAKLKVEYISFGVDKIPGSVQMSLYRVVQEALTNIVKHARASMVKVKLNCDAEGVFCRLRMTE